MHERISALLDGELDQIEIEKTLTLVTHDPEMSAKWHRYHLIRAAVKHEPITHLPGLAEAVEPLLGEESSISPSPKDLHNVESPSWWPRLAVAAGVAGLVAAGIFSILPTDDPVESTKLVARIDQATKWESTTPDVEHALNAFLVEHGEFTPMSSMNGLMSYAKFVSYDSD